MQDTTLVLSILSLIVLRGNKNLLADLHDQGADVHVAIVGFDADLGDFGGDRVVLTLAEERIDSVVDGREPWAHWAATFLRPSA